MFNKFLFLDNASIHHSKIFKEYCKNNKINIIYNTPYSPEYNPIEIMFSKHKKIVKDKNFNNSIVQLKKI